MGQGQLYPQESENKKARTMKYQAYFSFGWRFSGFSLNLKANKPELVIEKVKRFSTEIIKVSSSTSRMTDSKHTAMHETQAPLIGTWDIGEI